jgi:hypothetical protein
VWATISLSVRVLQPAAEAQMSRVQAAADQLKADGHSTVCAGTSAAVTENLLDGNPTTVIELGGGCGKCGIKGIE